MAKPDRAAVSTQSRNLVLGAARAFRRRWVHLVIAPLAIVAVAIALLALFFPFSQKRVTESLRETFAVLALGAGLIVLTRQREHAG